MSIAHQKTIRASLEGDMAALDTLVRTYHDRVYRFGKRVCRDPVDAEDAVQEAFLKLAARPEPAGFELHANGDPLTAPQ